MTKGTRENIINAFFILASKYPERSSFSLAEIAREAGITRQTIYKNHFNSYEEIIDYIQFATDRKIDSLFSEFDGSQTIDCFLCYVIIPELYNNKSWLRYLYSTAADPKWRKYLQQKYYKWILKELTINCHNFQLDNIFISKWLVNSVLALIEIWISEEFPIPPEKFSKEFLNLINSPLSDFFLRENSQQKRLTNRKAN
ncbi:TetR/AcrR family transcriptional regulator [Streptococcus tangpeifui]|uniref:TetR/AcrR family transcriptional regulator n=1 Tax=Streptococcus tangpeifui TaxID=2709400 RepID=UPI0013EAD214|nr:MULTISPECIES: TetR/AcrR family transcriptional regulator C-terminal domain-containing protein [unclassified Streptococcus]